MTYRDPFETIAATGSGVQRIEVSPGVKAGAGAMIAFPAGAV